MEPLELSREVLEALGAPFPEDEVEFLPRGNFEGKARALAYIDARSVMRRLDAAVGPANWSFDFDLLSPEGKMVKGKLTVLGVTKCDAGEGSSEDEVLKSAVSDALKRCAVHFGIGRYLYYLPSVWAPYDQRKRQFSETPRISPQAITRALAICGIPTQPAGAPNERRSIWAAGEGRTREAAPESTGDRKATTQRQPGKMADTPPACQQCDAVLTAAESQASRKEFPQVDLCPQHLAEARQKRSGKTTTPPADTGTMACSRPDCGKPLTKGQHDVSIRAFGQPLCPACQKQQARAAA